MQIYLLESTSRIKLNEEVNSIIKNDNKIMMNGLFTTLEDILNEAAYISMFQTMKYLVIKNADQLFQKMKKEDETLFCSYLKKPYPLSTLIFCCNEKVDGRKKTISLIKEKYNYKKISELTGFELEKYVNYLLKDYKVNSSIIKYIINSCANNNDLIYQEIQKLKIYYEQNDVMQLSEVKEIILPLLNDNSFKYIDAVLHFDDKLALSLLHDLYRNKVDPINLINLFVREIRLMLYASIMEENGNSFNEIKTNLKLQNWQLDKIMLNKRRFKIDRLEALLVNLEHIDIKIKSGKGDKFSELKIFMFTMMNENN